MENWSGGFLYRYRKWDDYTKKILLNGEFYYASFDSLNDPNEGKQISTELVKFILLEHSIKDNDPERVHSFNKETVRNIDKRESHSRKYKQSIKEELNEVGIVCLTARPDNNPMWHFYGDENKGICIEFYFPQSYSERYKHLCPCPVSYNEITSITHQNWAEILVFNKHSDWSYEKEYRLISSKLDIDALRIKNYPVDKMLCSVIVGHNMPNDQYQELKKLIREVNKKFSTKVTVHRRVLKKFDVTSIESKEKWDKRLRGLKFINASKLE